MGKDNQILKTLKPKRRRTRTVKIGNLLVGGDYPIAIQAMTKVKTACVDRVISQIKELEAQGAEIIRLAIEDFKDVSAIKEIKQATSIALVADIHFDYRLALRAIENGIDKIRINPGNIWQKDKLKEIIEKAKEFHIPIRIGFNSGSLRIKNSDFSSKDPVKFMVKEATHYLRFLEDLGFYDIIVSLKTSSVLNTIMAYEQMAKICDYPFHIGLTATGVPLAGVVDSSIALGVLLKEGIGDTLRVSLTDSAVQEVRVAKYILGALGLRDFGYQLISCPTCGRCKVDLVRMVRELETRLSDIPTSTGPIKLAVMGCVVNGPGEAKEADLGVAFGKREGLLFKKGRPFKKVKAEDCIEQILAQIKRL